MEKARYFFRIKSTKIVVYILSTAIILGGVSLGSKVTAPTMKEPQVTNIPQGKPTFTWSYTSFEKNEIPRTTISLTAHYPTMATTTKVVDTIEGGCNEYTERDIDVYPESQMIICYYAGFGRYYKVVENGNVYEVKRKEFEEASPDYNPPIAPFTTIVTF